MAPVDEGDMADSDFETALQEAQESIRAAYPDESFPDENSVDWLTALLDRERDESTRWDAAQILAMLAERFPGKLAPAVPDMTERLDDPVVRTHLIRTLGYVSENNSDAVRNATDRLRGLLEANEPAVVRDAVWVLSNLGETDPAAIESVYPVLSDLLSHNDEYVRRRAANALASIPMSRLRGERGTLEELLSLLDSASLYRTAGRTLVATAPAFGGATVDGLFERLESGNPTRREHAAWTLVHLADDRPDLVRPRWQTLIKHLRDDDDHQVLNSVAAALAAIVADLPEGDIPSALCELLHHEDQFVRRYACLALGDVAAATGAETTVAALADARNDDAPLVAREAEQRLASAAQNHPESVAAVAPDLAAESGWQDRP